MRRLGALLVLGFGLCGCDHPSARGAPEGYPSSYGRQIDAAGTQGALDIWSAIDAQKAAALVADFSRHYPKIRVRYTEIPAQQLYQRFRLQADRGGGTVDFLWSSAMDLQIKLVNDGYTQRYVSPERRNLLRWANWKNQAWGTTAEPIVFLYNRKKIAEAAVPRSHVALMQFLERNSSPSSGRISTYALPESAVGYLYLSQDRQATHDIWRLVRAMGANGVRRFARAEDIVHDIAAGNSAIGYNIVGSYALDQVQKNPDLGMVVPRDYTLLMSRIAVIPAAARHPDAAKLFLDFLLSRQGQSYLVAQDMPSVRGDVPGPTALRPDGVPLRAIRVGPALLINQDQLTRAYFLRRWRETIAPQGVSLASAARKDASE